jgi:hypothetical protein
VGVVDVICMTMLTLEGEGTPGIQTREPVWKRHGELKDDK